MNFLCNYDTAHVANRLRTTLNCINRYKVNIVIRYYNVTTARQLHRRYQNKLKIHRNMHTYIEHIRYQNKLKIQLLTVSCLLGSNLAPATHL